LADVEEVEAQSDGSADMAGALGEQPPVEDELLKGAS
jgi:hypothetical protein